MTSHLDSVIRIVIVRDFQKWPIFWIFETF